MEGKKVNFKNESVERVKAINLSFLGASSWEGREKKGES